MTIKRMVFRVAMAGALLVAPGVAWGGQLPTAGAVHHRDQATKDVPDGGCELRLTRQADGPPVITAPPSSDAIVVSDPGPGDGGGPK